MGSDMIEDAPEDCGLLKRAEAGDAQAIGELFERHRARLQRMVELRMDARLQGRIDAADVLQDAYLEVARSLPEYIRSPEIPVFLWLRFITGRKLQALHRHHLGTGLRDASRDISIFRGALPQASSQMLAAQLVGRFTSPSEAAARAEIQLRVQEALNSLEPLDRELLALRHFEQLTNFEAAQVLEISPAAAGSRFVRALKRLKKILETSGWS
jgi:RNA polymerase sigma-70 factor (ECF subfamily)